MALALQSGNLVKQKVKLALSGGVGVNTVAEKAFEALFDVLANQYGNPDLQFFTFSEVQADVAGGTVIIDAACKVYGVYVKKEANATDNWFWLINDATNDGTDADHMISLALLEASKNAFAIYPSGIPFDTGGVVTQYATDPIGKSDGSNGGDGFIVVGAA